MMIEPTEEMLRAGQDTLFEVCPEYTIDERESLAREIWLAMGKVAGVFAKPQDPLMERINRSGSFAKDA